MNTLRSRLAACWLRALVFASLLPGAAAHAVIDLNNDGIGDIYAMKYNAAGLAPGGDADNDGKTNWEEMVAGTDPWKGNSELAVSTVTIDASGVRLSWLSVAGKRYIVQTATDLTLADWGDQQPATAIAGTGEMISRVYPIGATAKYYRVVAQDMDTDHDGVSDWEELAVGFNPNSPMSNGLAGNNDLAAITAALQAQNVITVLTNDDAAGEPAAGQPGFDTGTFVIYRSGNLNAVTVNYTVAGTAVAGSDYAALSGSVSLPMGVNSAVVTVTALADAVLESPESVVLTVAPGAGYNVGAAASAALLVHDFAAPNGDGVRGRYWNNTSSTIPQFTNTNVTPNVAAPRLDRVESQINFRWPNPNVAGSPTSPGTGVNSDYFVARYTGEVLPEFSQIYTFEVEVDRGSRLWVNGQLLFSRWSNSPSAGTYSGTIELQAGKRVPIVYEFMTRSGQATAVMSWSSANRPKEIIPQARLFSNAPPQILSASEVLLIKDSPVHEYQIVASGEPTSFGAGNLPPGWNVNTTTGVVSGAPSQAGTWDMVVSATNAHGTGTGIVRVKVIATGGAISRDLWTGVPGTNISAIPLASAPTSSSLIGALETAQSAPDADDFGARIRGYLTAPATGVYKFWLTASDAAELYVSDDDEPVNGFKRAAVTAPTGFREWSSANAGKSPLLHLEAGRQYYLEVRHKAGTGADHVSVGWLKPGEGGADPANAAAPGEVVPGYALSPYVAAAPISGESMLFTTSMTAQGAAITSGYGSGSLQLSPDETTATLRYTYAALTTPVVAKHIHSDAHGGQIIFDIDTATPNQDGSYTWTIEPVGAISTADILNTIKSGQSYINVHTANYPSGEIRGNFRFQAASQTFTPPAPQTWSDPQNVTSKDSHLNPDGASRFLVQATFGSSAAEIAKVQSLGFEGWIDQQIALPATEHFPYVHANRNQTDPTNSTYSGTLTFNAWWRRAVTAPDQLRQRVAFALSEIMVVSESGPLDNRADALSDYYDMLLANAFGNVRTLLEDVTLHPAMGRYLDMLRNDKPNLATGRIPNENYAREIKQLFSIGLYRMHPDGSLMLNSKGELIPTYDQDAIIGFAHVFTGWDYGYTGGFRTALNASTNWIDPMREVPARHFTGQKRLLNNVVLPGLATVGGVPLDPYATHSSSQYNDPAYQALPAQELDAAHDALFHHPNIGPFLCRQLIQRLVTSTPSRGYLYRVVQKFNDNGSGVRGDMVAVIKAILLDHEARSGTLLAQQGFGKQREPVARVTALARAFPAPGAVAGDYTQSGGVITIETDAPHGYSSGHVVYLEFENATSGDPGAPVNALHTILSTPAVTPTTFAVRTRSFETATYTQGGAIVRFTATTGNNGFHYLVNDSVHAEYLDGTPEAPANGADTVEFVSSDELQFVFGAPTAKRGTYSQSSSSNTLTFSSTAHGFAAGASVHIDFVSGTAPSGVYTIATVAGNGNSFTIAMPDMVSRSGTALAVLAANVLPAASGNAQLTRAIDSGSRTGRLAVSYSDFTMDSTDTDLNQTPLNAPTVFNFFLPDYQFPGLLGEAGLITPEFEITSETTVIRQANFLYNGIFNDALSQRGLSSFKSGSRDIMFDLRPWMGLPPAGTPGADSTKPWVHNDNLNALIDQLNTLLMAGQLPSVGENSYGTPRNIVNAKQAIRDYVATLPYQRTISGLTGTTPTTVTCNSHGLATGDVVTISGVTGGSFNPSINGTFTITRTGTNTFTVPVTRNNSTGLSLTNARVTPANGFSDYTRDRIRAVVHLLVTSPDFTIQK